MNKVICEWRKHDLKRMWQMVEQQVSYLER